MKAKAVKITGIISITNRTVVGLFEPHRYVTFTDNNVIVEFALDSRALVLLLSYCKNYTITFEVTRRGNALEYKHKEFFYTRWS